MTGRRMITRQITKTTITIAKMEVVDGKAQAIDLPSETIVGDIKLERAQRIIDKKYKGESVHVLNVESDTQTYEISVLDFLEHATIKEVPEDE